MSLNTALGGRIHVSQPDAGFRFGNDSIYLCYFFRNHRASSLIDVGTGSGVIAATLLSLNSFSQGIGCDIQSEMISHANETAQHNKLEGRFKPILQDYRTWTSKTPADLIISNPPYYLPEGKVLPPNENKKIARFELTSSLEDLVEFYLRNKTTQGHLGIVLPATRESDMVALAREKHLICHRKLNIYNREGDSPVLVVFDFAGVNEAANFDVTTESVIQYDGSQYTDIARQILWGEWYGNSRV